MKNPKAACQVCGARKLKLSDSWNGRDWPGILCTFCGTFYPDMKSETVQVSCLDCQKPMGSVTVHQEFRHRTRAELADGLARTKAVLDDPKATPSLKSKAQDAQSEISRVIPWEDQRSSQLDRHLCLDCYRKRHAAGAEIDGLLVHHPTLCQMCGNPMGNWHGYEAGAHPDLLQQKFSDVPHIHGSSGQELSPCELKWAEIKKNRQGIDSAVKQAGEAAKIP